jgi:hypothetical protein
VQLEVFTHGKEVSSLFATFVLVAMPPSLQVGALITCIARKILKLPALRYVDDIFSADRYAMHFCVMPS